MISFFIGFLIFLFIGIPLLVLILNGANDVKESIEESSKNQQERKGLEPIFQAMGVDGVRDISTLEISRANFEKGVEKYYEILESVFQSETDEERRASAENILHLTPSVLYSQQFFKYTGLDHSLKILTKDMGYVLSGSGWKEYKKCFQDSLGDGKIEEIEGRYKENKFKIMINKDLFLILTESVQPDERGYEDRKTVNAQVNYKGKDVLSWYGSSIFNFKPDVWILDILKIAKRYDSKLAQMKVNKLAQEERDNLF